ncbi:MAG: alpha/beta hydrolase [Oxalobacteraceae bacterium]|nr:alpha/beta hydrolase [Oxalobacteraceae bacterium]
MRYLNYWVLAFMLLMGHTVSNADEGPVYGPELEGFDYPLPVQRYEFQSQRQQVHMAYLDAQPERANGRTVVLLHGKNFCAATWEGTMRFLQANGFRVIVPDQIGFCKSSKPASYQYTFQQLANNTKALLDSVGVKRFINPIGLEDWKAEGVPTLSLDQWHAREQQLTAERIRNYERVTYYVNEWRPEYERWVQMIAGMFRGPGRDIVAWHSALTYDMIFTQPVLYEFGKLQVPTLLMFGERDGTAIGKDISPPEVKAKLGDYPKLARRTAAAIPGSELVLFPELGHAPQMQDPDRFHAALIKGLK